MAPPWPEPQAPIDPSIYYPDAPFRMACRRRDAPPPSGRCDVSADRPVCTGTRGGNLPALPATGDRLLLEAIGRIGGGAG